MAMLSAFALLGAGCGGINASQTISPASFFLPGLLKADPVCPTNVPALLIDRPDSTVIASVR